MFRKLLLPALTATALVGSVPIRLSKHSATISEFRQLAGANTEEQLAMGCAVSIQNFEQYEFELLPGISARRSEALYKFSSNPKWEHGIELESSLNTIKGFGKATVTTVLNSVSGKNAHALCRKLRSNAQQSPS